MKFFDRPLTKKEIKDIRRKYGDYVKVTVDIRNKTVVVGCSLHADGEIILLDKNSNQEDVWGGGVDFSNKKVDCTAVLNLRPNLDNPSMEIIDSKKREALLELIKEFFRECL